MAVSIVKTTSPADVRKAVDLLGGMAHFVAPGEKVIVKPNVCAAKDSSTGVVTDPELVAEVCRMVAECGGVPTVAESPIYPFKSSRVFAKTGYADFEKHYGFPMIDIDNAESRDIRIPGGKAIDHLVVSDAVLTCDKLINVPVMKTHMQTVVTMGLKNLKGVVLGKQKHLIHLQGLDDGIVDLNTVIRSDLVILDGIVGMDGTGGPTNGKTVEMGVIVAGDNVVETDATGVRVMGGTPQKVDHIRLASERRLGRLDGFEVLGESVESVATARDLPGRPGMFQACWGFATKCIDAVREPLMRLTGGEQIKRSSQLGELVIDEELCNGCRQCLTACPVDALSLEDALACQRDACIGCFCCAEVCPVGALSKRF